MSWENVHTTVRYIISEIKAHIDQSNIGQKENEDRMNFHFPPGADIQKLKELVIDRSAEDRIIAKVMEELKSKRSLIVALDQKEMLQVIGDATAAAMIAMTEADDKKTGNPR